MKRIEYLQNLSPEDFAWYLHNLTKQCTNRSVHRKVCRQCENKLCIEGNAEKYLNEEV